MVPAIAGEQYQVTTRGEEATRRLGERIGRAARAGDVILLQGELGAGKTRVAQGIGRGLEVDTWVNSPTFVLVAEYAGRLRLFHADLYRLEDPREVRELHLAEQAKDGVLVVEWPERAWEEMPEERLLVRLEPEDAHVRRITLEAAGVRHRDLLTSLRRRTRG